MATRNAAAAAAWPRSAVVLGFGLGGLFDGILLHQVLEWHHLLSLVRQDGPLSLRTLILWDGLFHVLMYAVVALGLWLMWRDRARVADMAGARVLAAVLLGFGLWNVVDVVGFHWIAGIHRIRVDVPEPLPWDLAWLALFGLVPLAAALMLRRRGSGGGGGRTAAALSLVAVGMSLWAAVPPPAGASTVVFAPGVPAAAAASALARADARLLWADREGAVWSVMLPDDADRWALRRSGAVLIGGGWGVGGCAGWSRA